MSGLDQIALAWVLMVTCWAFLKVIEGLAIRDQGELPVWPEH